MHMKHMLLAVLIVAIVPVRAAFETEGYVVGNTGGSSTANNSPILVPSLWTWPSGETPVEMDPSAKYYTKVATSYFYHTYDVTAPGTEWVLDRRSTSADKYSTFLFGNVGKVTFPNLIINDGGTRFQCYASLAGGIAGKLTVKATKAAPFLILYDSTSVGVFPFSDLTLVGDATAGIELCGPATGRADYTTAKITFSNCDLSGYSGRIRVRMFRDAPISEEIFMAFHPGDVICPGELLCEAGGAISLENTINEAKFGTLTLEDGARIQSVGSGKMVVTGALAVNGRVIVDLDGRAASESADAWTLIACAAGVDVSAVDLSKFVFVNAPQRSDVDFTHTSYLKWFDEPGGGKSLKIVLPKIVTRNTVDASAARSDFEYATKTNGGTDYYWSNQGAPGLDEDANDVIYLDTKRALYVPAAPENKDVYTFPGRSLVIAGSGVGPTFDVEQGKIGLQADILAVGACLIVQNKSIKGTGSQLGFEDPEYGGQFQTCLLRGTLGLYGKGKDADIRSTYGVNRQLRIESTISGVGDIKFNAIRSKTPSVASVNAGTFELTADNSAFSGKMKLTEDYYNTTTTSEQTPNAANNIRLIVSDGRALGGAREEFAFDALFLEHHSELLVRDNVTLEAGLNRGVAIGDFGYVWMPEGKNLTINQPLNLTGTLTKRGLGTLTLAGAAMTFGSDGQSATPIANSNLLMVAAGTLRIANADAADGAAISFAAGTSLLVGTNDTAVTALRSVKAGSSLTAAAGAISVIFDVNEDTPHDFSTVICTSKDANLKFACTRPWKFYRVRVESDTVNDVTTYTAKVCKKRGLILCVK